MCPRVIIVAAVSASLSACVTDGGPTASGPVTGAYFPTADARWETVRPAVAGFDSARLASALDWAGAQNSAAVVVLWRGRLVMERYWQSWDSDTRGPYFSAGKTITAALMLELVRAGDVSLDAPVSRYLGPGWSRMTSEEEAVTVRRLLSMSSGTNDSLRRVVSPTAGRFYYNNPAYYQLFGIIAAAARQSVPVVAATRLFAPIGMSRTLLVSSVDTGEPGYIFWGSARDFARFGLLMLNHGRWNGAQVLADSALLARARQPSGTDNASYGWLWWLNGGASFRTPGPYLVPTLRGPLWPSAPADLTAALGKDDKKLYVVPSLDLVVVRLGERAPVSGGVSPEAISTFDNELWIRLMGARFAPP
jgi:CubicO group peptidase (beta-lactamase class C family)